MFSKIVLEDKSLLAVSKKYNACGSTEGNFIKGKVHAKDSSLRQLLKNICIKDE